MTCSYRRGFFHRCCCNDLRNHHIPHLLRADVLVLVIKGVAAGEEGPGQVHGGGGEGAAADAEEEGDDDAEDVLGAIAEGGEVGGEREERHHGPLGLSAGLIGVGQNGVVVEEADGAELSDLGDDGDESGGGRGGGEAAEGDGVGGDEEGFAGPGGGGDCQDREG